MSAKKKTSPPKPPQETVPQGPVWTRGWFGDVLAVLAGLAFMAVCMVLPLVGKAGVETPYADKNFAAFLVVLLVALVLSGAALASKLLRRRLDGSPWPAWSGLLTGSCLFLLLALLTGLLGI